MKGNIVGESFEKFVKKQIKVRQKIYGSKERTPQQLSYLNGKQAFVRLVSSVDIVGEEGIEKLKQFGFPNPEIYEGSQLAKDFILYAGTTLYDEFGVPTISALREGIGFTGDLLGDINKAYSIGGTEFGLQPMPTLGDVDVKYRNRGSLREANLTIKCFNPKQFEIIDTLYLRLGYTLLLEWGNSTYFDNNGEYVPNNFYNSLQGYMFDENNKDDQLKLLQNVEKLRFESGGNYDAFFGKVSNYSWNFENGVYNISLKLISLGDIVESLRLGFVTTEQSSNPAIKKGRGAEGTWTEEGDVETKPTEVDLGDVKTKPTEVDLLDNYKNSSDISLLLYTAATSSPSSFTPNVGFPFVNVPSTDTSTISSNNNDDENNVDDYSNMLYYPDVHSEENALPSDQISAQTQGDRDVVNARIAQTSLNVPPPTFNSLKNIAEKIGFESDIPFGQMILENKIAKNKRTINIQESSKDFVKIHGVGNNTSFNYIRFGALLEFIEKTQCIYNPNQPTNPSLLLIDYDPASNYMLSNESIISADPYKCIVSGGDNLFGYDTSEDEKDPFSFLPKYKEEIAGTVLGKTMNVYLNASYLTNLMLSLQTDTNEVLFFSLISNICQDINNSLGNLSSISPFIDENTNTLKIIEENIFPNNQLILKQILGKPVEHSPLDLFGYDNIETSSPSAGFVKNFGIKTEITNDLATTISIGAQAKGLTAKYDGSAFSYWNRGLQDRIVSEKTDEPKPKQENIPLKKKYKVSINDYNKLLVASALFSFNEDDISSYKTALKNIINFKKEQVIKGNRKPITSPAFLPLNLNLSLDGISGLKIYQSFRANSKFLPYPFPESLEFLIKGVSHKISNNVWTTTIDSLSIPISEEIEVDSRKKEARLGAKSNPISDSKYRKTAYPELAFTDPPPPSNQMSYEYAVTTLKAKYGDSLAKAVFAVMFAEASKSGENFNSAGGYNYAGVQTDNTRWGGPQVIIGQYARKDSKRMRSFAIFESDATFLDFMANRIEKKRFKGDDGDKWVERYLNSWVFLNLKGRDPERYKELFPFKKNIYNTAMISYEKYA